MIFSPHPYVFIVYNEYLSNIYPFIFYSVNHCVFTQFTHVFWTFFLLIIVTKGLITLTYEFGKSSVSLGQCFSV